MTLLYLLEFAKKKFLRKATYIQAVTFDTSAAQTIQDLKYRAKPADGTPVDKTIEDTWHRVVTAIAQTEINQEYQAK